jgi:S-formylglutathione hydrolase FrmB
MRRALLLAVLLLPGCGGGSSGDDAPRDRPAGPPVAARQLAIAGEAVPRRLAPLVLVPRDRGPGVPLLVLLHGQGGSPDSSATPELLAELARLGDRAPVVLLPDGGESSYWHDRDDGAWARMILEEAIPAAAARYGADARRVAVAGFSMGGFGALHLAQREPGRFCSIAAHSPAVFTKRPRPGEAFGEAFDDEADFDRTDPIRRARRLPPGTWVDVGNRDEFAPATRELVARMREPRFRMWSGTHTFDFWLRETPRWLRYHLDRCS